MSSPPSLCSDLALDMKMDFSDFPLSISASPFDDSLIHSDENQLDAQPLPQQPLPQQPLLEVPGPEESSAQITFDNMSGFVVHLNSPPPTPPEEMSPDGVAMPTPASAQVWVQESPALKPVFEPVDHDNTWFQSLITRDAIKLEECPCVAPIQPNCQVPTTSPPGTFSSQGNTIASAPVEPPSPPPPTRFVTVPLTPATAVSHADWLQKVPQPPHSLRAAAAAMRAKKDNKSSNQRLPCTLCDKTFYSDHNRRSHMKTVHHKVKDYACSYCDFSASRISNLKGHMNAVHLKLFFYVCPFCGDKKSRTNYFTKHLNALHGEQLRRLGVSADMVRYGVGFAYRIRHNLFSAKKPKDFSQDQMDIVLQLIEATGVQQQTQQVLRKQ